MKTILITGHMGLVGRYLKPILEKRGYWIKGIDLADQSGDITCASSIEAAISNCQGIIHLAAVARVLSGEQNPKQCWQTNAIASKQLLKASIDSFPRPWVLLASSREVYGQPDNIPITENNLIAPVNVYGRSKAYMEDQARKAKDAGLNTAIVRLANVYGCIKDYQDRVLPAFCRRAVEGVPLQVNGYDHLFDFTHINDTVDGIVKMVDILDSGEKSLPTVHLVSGIGTTLKHAAELAVKAASTGAPIFEASSKRYNVSRFIGCPERAMEILNWKATISSQEGITGLVQAFNNEIKVRKLA